MGFTAAISRFSTVFCPDGTIRWLCVLALCGSLTSLLNAEDRDVSKRTKQIIGATATIKESTTGIPFASRIDTGAHSCSLHVEKVEINKESKKPLNNVGKSIRFLIKNEEGKSDWIETKIVGVVRVRSSALKNGDFDRRYKVPLTLELGDFRKEVLVTLNDRTEMDYPLLIGRNFLRGDFLVDVSIDTHD